MQEKKISKVLRDKNLLTSVFTTLFNVILVLLVLNMLSSNLGMFEQSLVLMFTLYILIGSVLFNLPLKKFFHLLISRKKLFADKDRVYCETILTVTPEQGYFGYPGSAFFVMTSSFNIKKITKNYYKRKNWSSAKKMFVGGPVLTIVLKSNDKHLLY